MFVVIESIDGGGKGKQREEVVKFLEQKGTIVRSMEFPDHNTALWREYIHPALHNKLTLPSGAWFSAFAFEKFLWQEEIKKYKSDPNNLFLVDGYYTTTLVYQCLLQNSPTLDFGLKFADEFGIPKPDLTIYVDVNPKTALIRKNNEEGKTEKDIFEGDVEKQRWIQGAFQRMVQDQIWCKWVQVDGSGTIPEVRDLIVSEIRDMYDHLDGDKLQV